MTALVVVLFDSNVCEREMRSYPSSSGAVKLVRRVSGPVREPVAPVATATALSIVVPVFNPPARILEDSLAALAQFRGRFAGAAELILVDDGSEPATAERLAVFAEREPHVTLIRNQENRGKGFATARGLLAGTGRYRVFTDVDLAYPVDQIGRVCATLDEGYDLAVACRVHPESRYLMSPAFFRYLYSRHVMSRVFNAVVRMMLIPGMLDSQAGLKGMTAEAAQDLAPLLTVPGFAFDVELLYAAYLRGYAIAQMPVSFRYDSEPTTVRFAQDAVHMFGDCARIRMNGALGRYG